MTDLTYTVSKIRALVGSIVQPGLETGYVTAAPGDTVYIASDGDVEKSDASAAATAEAVGLLIPSDERSSWPLANTPVSIVLWGRVTGFSGLTPGQRIFVSDTTGKLADAAGTVNRCMGYALSATDIFLFPGMAAPTS